MRGELNVACPRLVRGVNKSKYVDDNRRHLLNLLEWLPSLPFSGDATRLCGEVRAALASQGTPIGPYDLQIAAIAVTNDCILVTHNTGEFSRIPGLKLEDWEAGK